MSAVPPSLTFGWRRMLLFVLIAEAAVVATFHETAAAMVDIWMRSETFNHALLVPPIAIWLIWEKRHDVVRIAPRPALWLGLPLVALAFAWLLGELAAVNAITQFALVAMVVVIVPLLIGVPAARTIAFPLGFLFFAVPFGEFVMPTLMDWTAFFTVLGVRASGIPVYQEGLHFVIPSGSWSVVEACSGVRYLIASIVVGTLYAYLSYRSLKRRLIFVGFSVLVPLVANWLRAYMIVMLGHLSGNRLAVGVDHLIYGWVFFGVVILAMFWIGARWREDGDLQPHSSAAEGASRGVAPSTVPPSAAPLVVTTLLSVLTMAIWPLADRELSRPTVPEITQIAPVPPVVGWQPDEQGFTDWRPGFQGYAGSTQLYFERDGRPVGVFMAYYQNQGENRKLVSSTNALVHGEDARWARVGGGAREIAVAGEAVQVRTTELREQGGPGLRVWQWYWINGRWTASDFVAKAYTALSRLTAEGDDSAVVIVFTTRRPAGEADVILGDFVGAAGHALAESLQSTHRRGDQGYANELGR